ncbi:MAG: glycoside hydrolase family 18 protein [Bryobacteraceae bacterium]
MKTTLRRFRFLTSGISPIRRIAQFLAISAVSTVLAFAGNQYVVGYWQGPTTSVPSLNVNQLTHLVYAFASVSTSAPYTCSIPNTTALPAAVSTLQTDFTNFKGTNSMLKIMISVGGANGSGSFSDAASHPGFASNCVNSILGSFTPGLVDGIDLDWESPAAPKNASTITSGDDTYKYNALMQDFRVALNAFWQANQLKGQPLLTSAIGPEGGAAYIDFTGAKTSPVPGATSSVDFFNVMTYDYAGGWLCTIVNNACQAGTQYTGANAPVAQVESDVNNLIKGTTQGGFATNIPAAKLTLGMPFYGVEFTGVLKASMTAVTTGASGQIGSLGQYGVYYTNPNQVLDYSYIAPQITSNELYHNTAGDAWIYTTGDVLYQYDDATTITNKVKWAESKNLAGVMAWSIDQDASGEPLLGAIAATMPVTNSSNCGCIQGPGSGGPGLVVRDTSTYNFENGVQNWGMDSTHKVAGVSTSTAVRYQGARSLAISFDTATTGANLQGVVYVSNTSMKQGGTVTFHVYMPADAAVSSVTAFIGNTSYQWSTDTQTTTFTPGAWTTFTIKVPANAMELGVSFESSDYWTGVAYIDAVNYTAP